MRIIVKQFSAKKQLPGSFTNRCFRTTGCWQPPATKPATSRAHDARLTATIHKDIEAMRSAVKSADPNVTSDGDQALKWADEMEHLLR